MRGERVDVDERESLESFLLRSNCWYFKKRFDGCERPSRAWGGPHGISATEGKDDVHLRFHLHRLTIQQIGLVTPGLHSFHGRLLKHGWSADDLEILNRAFLRDRGL